MRANKQATKWTTVQREVPITGVTTEARVRGRTDLDSGDARDRRSDAPMALEMEMTTAATLTSAETVGPIMFEPMEGNGNGKWRRRSEALATPTDW